MDTEIPSQEDVFQFKFKLKRSLASLRDQLDHLVSLKSTQNDSDALISVYKNDILPTLLNLRRHNRIEKDHLETRSKEARELNVALLSLMDTCNSLNFEARSLKLDIDDCPMDGDNILSNLPADITNNSELSAFDQNRVKALAHLERMRQLEKEQEKRREYQKQLAKEQDDLEAIESRDGIMVQKLGILKPLVKEFIVQTGPTLREPKDEPQ